MRRLLGHPSEAARSPRLFSAIMRCSPVTRSGIEPLPPCTCSKTPCCSANCWSTCGWRGLSCCCCCTWRLLGLVVLSGLAAGAAARSDDQPRTARRLVNLVFLGPVPAGLADGAELCRRRDHRRERAQELRDAAGQPVAPGAIVLGKLLASLCHLVLLIFASLPIVMLCLPLGGVSLYEVLAAYLGLIVVGDHVRHDQPGVQQLFSPHVGVAGRVLFVDLCRWRWSACRCWVALGEPGVVAAVAHA